MTKCTVNGCTSSSTDPRRQTFPFPEDRGLKEKWLKAMGRPEFKPTKYNRICQHHFKPEDFEKYHRLDGILTNVPLTRPKLKSDVIPTVFPGRPHVAPSLPTQTLPRRPPNEVKSFNEVFLKSMDLQVKLKPEENNKTKLGETSSADDFLLCRVCESTEELINILTDTNTHFREKLCQISCLGDDRRDDLLKFICRSCGERLEDLSTFRTQCQITYKKLLGEIAKREDKPKDLVIEEETLKEAIAEEFQDTFENLITDNIMNESLDKEYIDHIDSENSDNYWADDNSGVESVIKVDEKSPEDAVKESDQEDSFANSEEPKHTTKKTNFHCLICNITLKSSYQYSQHQIMHTGKAFACDKCDRSYSSHTNLQRHVRSVHDLRRDHVCKICNKAFIQSTNLKDHMYVHQEERNFKCNQCDKAFKRDKCLTLHKYSHIPPAERSEEAKRHYARMVKSQKKVCVCPICGKTSNYVNQHLEHVRSHTGEKPFKCSHCQKCFGSRNILKSHIRIHTGEKPYKCETCGAAFRQKPHLNGHMLLHTGEKPHRCQVCDKDFRNRSNFVEHMRLHTGEKPRPCRLCPEKFKNSKLLKKHCQTVHGKC